ncbi:MAG TPA: acyl-CoA dehydrogenase family protein [Candidatus Cybelea sp.]|nr:acyl-CoA dehydrogenase family protein [Candidatus Cybelea sp.]
MDFELSPRARELRERVESFFRAKILPRHREWHRLCEEQGIAPPPFVKDLQAEAKAEGLWNLALPKLADDEPGTRLTNLEFAPLAEIMGRLPWASEVFNCHAPNVPNMEILQMFATPAQKRNWLRPLLNAEIRSCFGMTEPDVASSDARNIATSIRRDGNDSYVIDGHKWFITGAGHPECKVCLLMGVTDPAADPLRRHSIVIVPTDAPGFEVVRSIPVFHHHDRVAPHAEIKLTGVRVPLENILGREGEGFAMAQARLGPARIHHCMRAIGTCEVLIQLMHERASSRTTFGVRVIDNANVQDWIALSRLELEQARLLVYKAAWALDRGGNKAARREIALIKVAVARVYQAIADRAVQVFGAMGVTDDAPVASALAQARAFRIYDGPDEVHLRGIFRLEQPGSVGDSAHYMTRH